MTRRRRDAGFTLIEIIVAVSIVAIALVLSLSAWTNVRAHQGVRSATAQVAADLRVALERAKSERTVYTATFTSGGAGYRVSRSGGGFDVNGELPAGVTIDTTATITFSPFGRPDAARSLTIRSGGVTGTVSINAIGSVSYNNP